MSRIRMYVYITNESDGTLTFVRDEIASGEYTPDWRPPAVVGSRAKGEVPRRG